MEDREKQAINSKNPRLAKQNSKGDCTTKGRIVMVGHSAERSARALFEYVHFGSVKCVLRAKIGVLRAKLKREIAQQLRVVSCW